MSARAHTERDGGMAWAVVGEQELRGLWLGGRGLLLSFGFSLLLSVIAYLAAMLAAGATPLEAAMIANYAAGVEVGKLGAATVSLDEVLDAYDAHAG